MTRTQFDLHDVVEGLRRDVEATQRLGDGLARVRQQVAAVRITESAAGGAVQVTVGENGMLTEVTMTDGIRKLSPRQVGDAVLAALRKAQAGYPRRLAEIMADSVGDERMTRFVVDAAERRFPPVADEPGARPRTSGPRELKLDQHLAEDPPGGGPILRRS